MQLVILLLVLQNFLSQSTLAENKLSASFSKPLQWQTIPDTTIRVKTVSIYTGSLRAEGTNLEDGVNVTYYGPTYKTSNILNSQQELCGVQQADHLQQLVKSPSSAFRKFLELNAPGFKSPSMTKRKFRVALNIRDWTQAEDATSQLSDLAAGHWPNFKRFKVPHGIKLIHGDKSISTPRGPSMNGFDNEIIIDIDLGHNGLCLPKSNELEAGFLSMMPDESVKASHSHPGQSPVIPRKNGSFSAPATP